MRLAGSAGSTEPIWTAGDGVVARVPVECKSLEMLLD
jgi:hypothetical protein